jgi:hypothetical protein
MHRKKYIQQFAIVDLVGIETDPHHFYMPGVTVAHRPIRRLIGATPHVARLDVTYSGETLKNRFDAPETSAAENRFLLFRHTV